MRGGPGRTRCGCRRATGETRFTGIDGSGKEEIRGGRAASHLLRLTVELAHRVDLIDSPGHRAKQVLPEALPQHLSVNLRPRRLGGGRRRSRRRRSSGRRRPACSLRRGAAGISMRLGRLFDLLLLVPSVGCAAFPFGVLPSFLGSVGDAGGRPRGGLHLADRGVGGSLGCASDAFDTASELRRCCSGCSGGGRLLGQR